MGKGGLVKYHDRHTHTHARTPARRAAPQGSTLAWPFAAGPHREGNLTRTDDTLEQVQQHGLPAPAAADPGQHLRQHPVQGSSPPLARGAATSRPPSGCCVLAECLTMWSLPRPAPAVHRYFGAVNRSSSPAFPRGA
eukprot:COSAG01_NODE_605_length_14890_cov_10.929417_7_plen_137_part_00